VLGLTAIVSPLQVAPALLASDFWWMVGMTIMLFPLMFTALRVSRGEGVFLLVFYAVYIARLVLGPAAHV
jgi:cation:H+ antiporter